MNFKKWVKSIQTAGYNGARTVYIYEQISKVLFPFRFSGNDNQSDMDLGYLADRSDSDSEGEGAEGGNGSQAPGSSSGKS